jgi:hypothetical protein
MIISEPNDFVADVFGDPMLPCAVNPRVQGLTTARSQNRLAVWSPTPPPHRCSEALVIEDIVTGMRRVIDQLPYAERKLILTSMRRKWSDIADRLEAPSSRNH